MKTPKARQQSELQVAIGLIESLVDDEPCRYDHNHSCQEHYYFYIPSDEVCPVQAAKDFVAEHKGGA